MLFIQRTVHHELVTSILFTNREIHLHAESSEKVWSTISDMDGHTSCNKHDRSSSRRG